MGKEVKEQKEVIQVTPPEGPVDLQKGVEVTCTEDAPHHSKGDKIIVSEYLAQKMKANGWAK